MASIILDECIDTNSVLQVELEEVRIELSVKEAELEETHSEMEALRDELKVKEDELKAKEDELNLKAAELVQKQTELGERQVELVRKQTELGEKQVELEASQAEKEATQAELETATVTMRHKESELEARQTQLEEAIKQVRSLTTCSMCSLESEGEEMIRCGSGHPMHRACLRRMMRLPEGVPRCCIEGCADAESLTNMLSLLEQENGGRRTLSVDVVAWTGSECCRRLWHVVWGNRSPSSLV